MEHVSLTWMYAKHGNDIMMMMTITMVETWWNESKRNKKERRSSVEKCVRIVRFKNFFPVVCHSYALLHLLFLFFFFGFLFNFMLYSKNWNMNTSRIFASNSIVAILRLNVIWDFRIKITFILFLLCLMSLAWCHCHGSQRHFICVQWIFVYVVAVKILYWSWSSTMASYVIFEANSYIELFVGSNKI